MTVKYAVMDPIHGKVEISFDVDTGVVDVRNGNSHALLTRRVDSPRREGTPIGTRAAADLFFTVGGDEVELTVGKGFLSRRSYSVSALVDGVSLNFAPVDDANSAFTRDGLRSGTSPRTRNPIPDRPTQSGRARRAPTNLSSDTPWPKPSIVEHSTGLLP
ncbi:hypothetical protein B0E55_00765 [Rhodococcus sp. 66b]|nr:hypothetical protein B0E55_00765 [Rhodococcus sp. 66b]